MVRFPVFLAAALAVAAAAPRAQVAFGGGSVPVRMDVAPLAPLDLLTPYASPRDAARHRLQATLAQLQESKDVRAGVRGLAQALATDPSYGLAAYNLGVLCAIAEQWEDALGAFQEAARLDPALATAVGPELERLTLITTLERAPGGATKWRYERALFDVLSASAAAEARMQRLLEIAKIDPSRWETPALMAVAMGDDRQYESAARFLQVAATNATDPAIRTALEAARTLAEREHSYAKTFGEAAQLAGRGQWKQAADSFEAAWHVFPARAASGMQAAVARLMVDDTTGASRLLWQIRATGVPEVATKAAAMLKALEPVEPGARQPAVPAPPLSADETARGEPARFATLIPETRTPQMALLGLAPLKFMADPAPVRLYESLSMDPMVAVRAAAATLPSLPPPVLPGEAPMLELRALRAATVGGGPPETVSRAVAGKVAREVAVDSVPRRAAVFVDNESTPVCRTPCVIQTSSASMALRLQADGYDEKKTTVQFSGKPSAAVTVALDAQPGFVVIDPPGGRVVVNGIPAPGAAPLELALPPGLHRIDVVVGQRPVVTELMVKPGVRIRFPLGL